MAQYITVQNKAHLDALQNHEQGEIAYCIDTKELWVYDEEQGWVTFQVENKGIDLNLYELNKSIVAQLEPMTVEEINEKLGLIKTYYVQSDNNHHMLLCRDFNYYTIFVQGGIMSHDFAETVCSIITELGDIYSIELNDDNAIEIWIKPITEESPYAFYLFPYDAGVVYYG